MSSNAPSGQHRQLAVEINLVDDLVLSRIASTEGQHESLDYIPGATLLGATAARLYSALGTDAFTLFHSGKIRFGNALPISAEGALALPTPLSWQHEKSRHWHTAQNNRRYIVPDVLLAGHHGSSGENNHVADNTVRKQVRGGYVTQDGQYLKPATGYRMKTALAPEAGRAATSQLFGYHSLNRKQTFRAIVSAQTNAISDALWQQIVEVFNGKLRLGRSRSAQYGRVMCHGQEVTTPSCASHSDANPLYLLAKSDLALFDCYGNPSHNPQALFPDKPQAWCPKRSAIRTRSYSPYNSYRQSYDEIRHVISAGSVLVFESISSKDLKAIANGVGRWREQGLGEILINPAQLVQTPQQLLKPQALYPQQSNHSEPVVIKAPDHPLIDWLAERTQQYQSQGAAEQLAAAMLKELQAIYHAAKRFNGRADVGPSATQWGQVKEALKNQPNREDLNKRLFGPEGSDAIAKDKDLQWSCPYAFGEDKTFATWLRQQVSVLAPQWQDLGWPEHHQALIIVARGAREFVRHGAAKQQPTEQPTEQQASV